MIKQFILLPTVIFVSFNFVPYNSPSQNVSFKFFSSNESTLNLSGNNTSLSTISNQSGDNMVDYNFETGEISFESFNPDSYQKRTSDSINEVIRNSTSSNSTSNDEVILENKQDYTIAIGDNNFNAIRGFFPAEAASILSPKGIGGVYGEDDRTGYIHNEYVVMSPIRRNIHEAFIEYSFSEPISKIDIQLSFWRDSSMEWLTKDNGSAELSARRSIGGLEVWTQSLDLLSDETALPTDRAYPNTYSVSFGIPVYGFRLSAETHEDYYNDSNRGRICIGDIDVYEYVF